jgi:hypothetical protein
VKRDRQLEREVLSYLKAWRLDPDRPAGEAPINYPETLTELPLFASTWQEEGERHWRELQTLLGVLGERGWVRNFEADGVWGAEITTSGLDRLDWHIQQDPLRRLARAAKSTSGTLFFSVVLPIVVAILTTVATQRLLDYEPPPARLGQH